MVKFGVIGYGYWGPNVVRNLDRLDGASVVAVCDKDASARNKVKKVHPHVRVTDDARELMASTEIDAIAVVTPVWTHYELAKAALENGKHIFVEKPFASNTAQAEELIELAERKNLKIMVDHTFLFTGAVQKISQLLGEGALGKLYYYDSTRVNLGLFQHDINVVWDLAPHDLSIMDHLIQESPEAIVATGQSHLNGLEDSAFITL
jgi:predicted dehydrogenase